MQRGWILSFGLLLAALPAVPGNSQSGRLSPDQARAKVKQVAGISDAGIARSYPRAAGGRSVYQVELKNGDEYRVDAETGALAVYYGSRRSPRTTEEIS